MESGFEIVFCRQCRNALSDLRSIEGDIMAVVSESSYTARMSHERIKAGFSACPNSCSSPQIKDFGVIAFITPELNPELCTSCGRCAEACRENAIDFDEFPVFNERCIGCGDCVRACPSRAISGKVRLRVLAGGRLGRHPRFAEVVAVVSGGEEVLEIFRKVVEISEEQGRRFSHIEGCVEVLRDRLGLKF
ncbi:Nitrite and sulphite reductase 4Fe-4S domain [Geoglobus ahangari]|uniref:Nitrite and sulphite reductase 4Fe-4S domain n=1 Tax=Geoglobus ahangari TaxID=113653 RepID=A0A0F7IFB0_9EURY|nr:4Fe-4S binding protein [Geoglobus ahangari]AKG91454.1 Nitrite and sulphite reductase 4Fe-4S domain [Geoglobus ahangari]